MKLETESAEPDFWHDTLTAQRVMRQLSELRDTVDMWCGLEQEVSELLELAVITAESPDETLEEEISSETSKLVSRVGKAEFQLLFSDEYDRRGAIMAIHAGAGGTESQDWADMLLRMYLRWAERNHYATELLEVTPGEEAGIKSAMLEIKGKYVYGYLKSECGVHRLVRLSPFDADHARHTSFVLVETLPRVEQDTEVNINTEDLRIDTFRSSGPGGQHMQKTSSAVRIVHIPTGIVITCQSQRSQLHNKEAAMCILQSRLLELEMAKKAEEKAKLKGDHVSAGWGNQIRSYVLHPYKMVKDHRSGYETSDANTVLDGDLEGLMKAFLKSRVGST